MASTDRAAAGFRTLVQRALAVPGRQNMRPVIEKELLHYDVLYALETHGLLDNLTFQGGTALRLCYGAARFSEDLDFVGGVDFCGAQLHELRDCIETYIGRRYGLEVAVKEPQELLNEPAYSEVKVDKWQIAVVTAPARPDIPKQRVKLEVANLPAYSREPRPLQQAYDFLPDGYSDLLIFTESLNEIMADKLVALINTQRYVRHRDIWDLRWLGQHGATLDIGLLESKLTDYRVEAYDAKLDAFRGRLREIIEGKAFADEMRRFLPADVLGRTLDLPKFRSYLYTETDNLLTRVADARSDEAPEPEFRL